MKGKILVIMVSAAVGILAVVTAYMLLSTRKISISPAAPESAPGAAGDSCGVDCGNRGGLCGDGVTVCHGNNNPRCKNPYCIINPGACEPSQCNAAVACDGVGCAIAGSVCQQGVCDTSTNPAGVCNCNVTPSPTAPATPGTPSAQCSITATVKIPTPPPTKSPSPTTTASPSPSAPSPTSSTASPSPSSSTSCKLCNYQADAFWGPVIEVFGNSNRYSSPVMRLIGVVSDRSTSYKNQKCPLSPITESPVSVPALPRGCEKPVERGYLTASFDTSKINPPYGLIKVTIRNKSSSCTYAVGLASYKANWLYPPTKYVTEGEIFGQNIYDKSMATLGPRKSVTLTVKAPTSGDGAACYSGK